MIFLYRIGWRTFYQVLLHICLAWLLWRSFRNCAGNITLKHWIKMKAGYPLEAHDFNRHSHRIHKPIWIHAVSMGETRAAGLLLKTWSQHYPNDRFILTYHTATARQTAEGIATQTDLRDRCHVAPMPLDTPWALSTFMRHYQPIRVILLESELWPALSWYCHRHTIPLAVINARMSPKSYVRIKKWGVMGIRYLWDPPTQIVAQDTRNAERWQWLGIKPIIGGQLKYDVSILPESSETIALGKRFHAYVRRPNPVRPVLLLASSREGEEAIFLRIWQKLITPQGNRPLLMIVPRHPERFLTVAEWLHQQHLHVQCRSKIDQALMDDRTEVWLGDSIGEMFAYYRSADIVAMGGGLLPYGGQNPIEAFTIGVPVIIGPHAYNFEQVTQEASEKGAAICMNRLSALEAQYQEAIQALMNAPEKRMQMIKQQQQLIQKHQGTVKRTIDYLTKADT